MKKSNLLSFIGLCGLASLFPGKSCAQILKPAPISAVSIVSPANRAVFYAPVDIPIFAYVRDTLLAVTNVEFYAGTNDLGPGTRLQIAVAPSPYPTRTYGRDQFSLVWTNPPPGTYALMAVAVGGYFGKSSATSAPVNITVLASSPTATNATDVASIVATDPVAIEGTNCWVWRGLTNSTPSWTNWLAPVWEWFTNCGPKNATFTVRRFGDCTAPLTLNYTTGGTATNGVDYVFLPGVVTIPAGQAYALLTVVPTDDGIPGINKTVSLTLAPSTNLPPEYSLGVPRIASGLIIDSNQPRPTSGMLSGNVFHVNAAGPDGSWFSVQYSTDLLNWSSLCTNQVINGSIDFVDPDAPNDASRFYRAVPQGGPPAQ